MTLYLLIAIFMWFCIVGLILATIALCICVHELRKLVQQVRKMIVKVSPKNLNLEIEDPDQSDKGSGTVYVADGWDDGIENPRD